MIDFRYFFFWVYTVDEIKKKIERSCKFFSLKTQQIIFF